MTFNVTLVHEAYLMRIARVSYGYNMLTKHLCGLIHITIKGEVGTVKHVKPFFFADRSKAMLFCGSFLL